jgi:aspartate aminotransferase-like enzyme
MQAKVQEKNRTPTVALRAEVKEDVAAVRQAVANLETTTAENWWERHQQATERTVDDIEADVRHFVPKLKADGNVARPAPVGTSASFEARRDDFVDRVRTQVDAWEDQLKAINAAGARKTELDDTRARIDKLQDDLDRLRTVDADDWWDVSRKRVSEYIDRLETSIGRLDNDK